MPLSTRKSSWYFTFSTPPFWFHSLFLKGGSGGKEVSSNILIPVQAAQIQKISLWKEKEPFILSIFISLLLWFVAASASTGFKTFRNRKKLCIQQTQLSLEIRSHAQFSTKILNHMKLNKLNKQQEYTKQNGSGPRQMTMVSHPWEKTWSVSTYPQKNKKKKIIR